MYNHEYSKDGAKNVCPTMSCLYKLSGLFFLAYYQRHITKSKSVSVYNHKKNINITNCMEQSP
jgi:hypothetical protein